MNGCENVRKNVEEKPLTKDMSKVRTTENGQEESILFNNDILKLSTFSISMIDIFFSTFSHPFEPETVKTVPR